MLGLGPREIVIVAIILVLLFGSKKVPELTRGVGDAIRHIRKGFSDENENENENEKNGKIGKNS